MCGWIIRVLVHGGDMMGFIILVFLLSFLGLIIWGYWMHEIEIPPIPETEQEKHVRQMKMRISEAEWKFKREIGQL